MMVADEFGIERSIVHEWVRDGRLEYKKRPKF
jgi:predicted site-specific integrase-resolvase